MLLKSVLGSNLSKRRLLHSVLQIPLIYATRTKHSLIKTSRLSYNPKVIIVAIINCFYRCKMLLNEVIVMLK